jgi:hypothetical protein
MFPYSCPSCSQRLLALPDRVGQRTICPKCLRPLTIPQAERPPADWEGVSHVNPDIDHDAPPPAPTVAKEPVELTLGSPPRPSVYDVDHILSVDTESDDESALCAEHPLPDDEIDLGLTDDIQTPIELTPAPVGYAARVPATASAAAIVPARNGSAPYLTLPPRPAVPPVAARYAPPAATPEASRLPAPLPPVNAPTPTPSRLPRHETGMVSFATPGLSGLDLSAELTAALSMRMKPPPEPAADLALTTGGWLLACAAVAILWVAGVLSNPSLLPYVALLGVLMLAFGYGWAAYLVGRTRPALGVWTLLPPVMAWRIWQPFGDNGYRPLRFVLTGALALALFAVSAPAREVVTGAMAALEFERKLPDAAPEPPAARLLAATTARNPEAVATEVARLSDPSYRATITPADTPAVVAALKQAAAAPTLRPDARLKAVEALLEWSEADGRAALIDALSAPSLAERRGAMTLAPKWADAQVAAATAARLSARAEESYARDALYLMPPHLAEAALLPLLRQSADDPVAMLTVAELLERVGGPKSADALTALAKSADRDSVRDELTRIAATVSKK